MEGIGGFFNNVTLVDQMYCCDLLLNLDGLTCTVTWAMQKERFLILSML